MGTNYFHRTNICECCGRYDELHIGKSSGGWQFSFRGYCDDFMVYGAPVIRSYRDWLVQLEPRVQVFEDGKEIKFEPIGRIFDEYGKEVSLDDFKTLVEQKKSEPLNHTTYCWTHHPDHARQDCWLDPEGHSFSSAEFS